MKSIVVVPTYNERQNLEPLAREIWRICPDLHLLIVDDNSPDGCGDLAADLARNDPRFFVLRRHFHRGRGSAGIAGFKLAIKWGYDKIIEMDADFSHQPHYLPTLLQLLGTHPIVVGSRFVKGGQDLDRGWGRWCISQAAGLYIRAITGLRLKDPTSGFRGFQAGPLRAILQLPVVANGPAILQELLMKGTILGYRPREFPIEFIDRRAGASTFNWRIMAESLLLIPLLGWCYQPLWRKSMASLESMATLPPDESRVLHSL